MSVRKRPRGVTITTSFGEPPIVKARAAELVSAIVNLVSNAVDALEDGGTIVLSTGADDAGGWVRVVDDGPGIPDDVKARVFEPFFTTKAREGTGLGLSMVWSFVQRHGGRVTVDSEVGKGASFTLWLPEAVDA